MANVHFSTRLSTCQCHEDGCTATILMERGYCGPCGGLARLSRETEQKEKAARQLLSREEMRQLCRPESERRPRVKRGVGSGLSRFTSWSKTARKKARRRREAAKENAEQEAA